MCTKCVCVQMTLFFVCQSHRAEHELDLLGLLRSRHDLHYGLKYDVVSLANGNATLACSVQPHLAAAAAAAHAAHSAALTLSLTLNSCLPGGIGTLVRADFLHNVRACGMSQNVKCLWQWFEGRAWLASDNGFEALFTAAKGFNRYLASFFFLLDLLFAFVLVEMAL